MASRIRVVLLAFCVAALAVEAFVYHATHPRYSTVRFEDALVSLDIPSAWPQPHWYAVDKGPLHFKDLYLRPEDAKQDFETRWDREPNVYLTIRLRHGLKGDPREVFKGWVAKAPRGPIGAQLDKPLALDAVKIAGHDAWMMTVPYNSETLDIVTDPGSHPLKAIYSSLFSGEQVQKTIMFPVDGSMCEIEYVLPGDKIARARYERVFGRILDSLKIKGS